MRFSPAARRARVLLAVGMGGSGLGTDVVRGLLADRLTQPLVSVRAPELPAAARPGCLALLISYSGTTAETIAAARVARQRRLPLAVITVGGELAVLAKRWNAPLYLIGSAENPSGQPRLGVGFMATGVLMALHQLGWWRFTAADQQAILRTAGHAWQAAAPEVPQKRNPVKRLAVRLERRFVLTMASDRYYGNAHVLANQLNENAKMFAAPFALPELNHHLLEGMRFPAAVRSAAAVTLQGAGDEPLARRFELTAEVLRRNRIPTYPLKPFGRTPLAQAYGYLAQSGLLSYYLALLHRIDPSGIPWVNFFKKSLGGGAVRSRTV